jgi:hypothetical protein
MELKDPARKKKKKMQLKDGREIFTAIKPLLMLVALAKSWLPNFVLEQEIVHRAVHSHLPLSDQLALCLNC